MIIVEGSSRISKERITSNQMVQMTFSVRLPGLQWIWCVYVGCQMSLANIHQTSLLLLSSTWGQPCMDKCRCAVRSFRPSGCCIRLWQSDIVNDLREENSQIHSGKASKPGQLPISKQCSMRICYSPKKSPGQLNMVRLRMVERLCKFYP